MDKSKLRSGGEERSVNGSRRKGKKRTSLKNDSARLSGVRSP